MENRLINKNRLDYIYTVNSNGVKKSIETWNLTIPLHDNDGNPFNQEIIDSILEEISLNYPGFTIVNNIGYWKNLGKKYLDNNLQLIIDTFPFSQ